MAQALGNKRAKIRKGDQVIVITGRDKGKRGRVLEVKPAEGKIKVEGAGMIKRHQRANTANNRGGGIIEREAFVNISNVALLDPGTGKPTRVRYDVGSDGTKTRVAAGSGQAIESKAK
jgi:large subunit ribosomal protein L24